MLSRRVAGAGLACKTGVCADVDLPCARADNHLAEGVVDVLAGIAVDGCIVAAALDVGAGLAPVSVPLWPC